MEATRPTCLYLAHLVSAPPNPEDSTLGRREMVRGQGETGAVRHEQRTCHPLGQACTFDPPT